MSSAVDDLVSRIRVDDRSATSPVILHVPHSSRFIPEICRPSFVIGPEAVERQLDLLVDSHTDRIADAVPLTSRVQHGLVRLVVDVERFPDESEEMNAVGMGVLYTHGARREQIRRPSADEREALMTYFDAYSRAFADLVGATLAVHGQATIIDVHSFGTHALPFERHGTDRRPQVCLGADEFHTPARLVEQAIAAFAGFETIVNEPFRGSYVPLRFYQCDARVHSLMIEIRRDQYMDETTLEIDPRGFSAIGVGLSRLVESLAN